MRYVHVFMTRWVRATRQVDSFRVYPLTVEDPIALKVAARISKDLQTELLEYSNEIRLMLMRQHFNNDIDGPFVFVTNDEPMSREFIETLVSDTDDSLERYKCKPSSPTRTSPGLPRP